MLDREQLMGRYVRLMEELAMVQDRSTRSRAWADRLASDIAATVRQIVTLQPPDDQVGRGEEGLGQVSAPSTVGETIAR